MFHWLQNNKRVTQSLFYVALFVVLLLTQLPSIEIKQEIEGLDKYEHFLSFFFLVLLGLMAYSGQIIKIGLFLFFYGILIEILQKILPYNRSFDSKDILADVLGIVVGILFFRFFIDTKINI